MVTAAVYQPLAASPLKIVSRGYLVEMERLGIELLRKPFDSFFVDPEATRAKSLPHVIVFEVSAPFSDLDRFGAPF
jgi:hypothetical protein